MKPADPAKLLQDAIAHHRRGDFAPAETLYREILRQRPADVDALHLLGMVLNSRGDTDAGIGLIEQALKLRPDLADAHYNLGNIYVQKNRLEDAAHHFKAATQLQPQNALAIGNLGSALLRLERYEEAEAAFKETLRLDPQMVSALLNTAVIADVRGDFDETLAICDRVLKQDPQHVEAHYQRALALLARERFTEGWDEYAWRLKRPQSRGQFGMFAFPYWQGEPLAGRRLLVWGDQGPGDEIMAASMLPDVLRQGASVAFLCSERMAPLFQRAFPTIDIIAADGKPKDGTVIANVNSQASMVELGRYFRPSADAFAAQTPLLVADPECTARLRHKYLEKNPGNRVVGISWRSKRPDMELEKSIPLEAWANILQTPGITFVNLQYGDCEKEIAAINGRANISLLSDPAVDPMRDLDVFAAQVAAMDLVISASNTTVHFAGGLGRPVWTLVPANRGRLWYWGLTRDVALWYPSMRLVRQTTARRWDDTLARVASDLAAWRAK